MTEIKKPQLTSEEIETLLEEGSQAIEQPPRPPLPTDLTPLVKPYRMHEFISIPKQDLNLKITGPDVEFLLWLFSQAHGNLLGDIQNAKLKQDERQQAYDSALKLEHLYADFFAQLKLNKPERIELH